MMTLGRSVRLLSKLGVLTVRALKYMKNEWKAMERILQNGNLEISNNLAEQMMRHIKLNLKNCLNIGSCLLYTSDAADEL